MTSRGKKRQWTRIQRDTLLFLAGLALVVNEAVIRQGPERPYMIVLFGAMMGLPLYFRNDEKKSDAEEPVKAEPPTVPQPERPKSLEYRGFAWRTHRPNCSFAT